MRLKSVDWQQLRGKDKAARAAALVLNGIMHRVVEGFYEEGEVFHLDGHPQLLDE